MIQLPGYSAVDFPGFGNRNQIEMDFFLASRLPPPTHQGRTSARITFEELRIQDR